MIPFGKGRLIGLVAILLVLVFFATRKGEEPAVIQNQNNNDMQGQKSGDEGVGASPKAGMGMPSHPPSSTVSASVKPPNTYPVIKSIRFLPMPVSSGQDIRAEVVSEDKEGDFVQLFYEWKINGKPVTANDHDTLHGDQVRSADRILVFVTPADPYSSGEGRVSPMITVLNQPPEVISLPPNKDENGKYTYQMMAKDPDSDTLNYLLIKGPPGMEVDSVTGLVQWTATPLTGSQSHVVLEVNDGKGGKVSQQFTLQTTTQ